MFKTFQTWYLSVMAFLAVSAFSLPANASITAAAETAISAAKDDALTVGGYVVAAIAALVVIGLIITMVRKV